MSRFLITTITLLLLAGCGSFFHLEKNHFIQPRDFEVDVKQAWVSNTSGTQGAFLRLTPAYADGVIITTDAKGGVYAVEKATGKRRWSRKTKQKITSGPGIGGGGIFFGTSDAQVVAIDFDSGVEQWRALVPNQVLAAPQYSNGIVLVKTLGGDLIALDAHTGQEKWHYGQGSPRLVLRGSSAPQIAYPYVISGFADGRIVVLTLDEGKLLWERRVAEPTGFTDLQRMVDISADPLVKDGVIYVTSYQGNVSAVDLTTSNILWQHDLSSESGLATYGRSLIATDTDGLIWDFNRQTGSVTWQQSGVKTRHLTRPVIIGDYLSMADEKGFVYWLSLDDGRFVAWNFVGGGGVVAAPIVADDYLIVLTKGGQMFALQAQPRATEEHA